MTQLTGPVSVMNTDLRSVDFLQSLVIKVYGGLFRACSQQPREVDVVIILTS